MIERLAPVIDWHRTGVLPWSQEFVSDPRLDIVKGDFFELVARDPAKRYHAILIDIDDSPDLLWHKSHAAFYNRNGIKAIERHLVSGGVLGLWYAAEPDGAFVAAVRDVFASADLVEVHFENPCLRQPETNYLVLARSHDANRHSA